MSDLVPSHFGGRTGRQFNRDLQRLGNDGRMALARVEVGSAIEIRRAEALADVAGAALDSVARVSLRADQLSQIVPSAAGRLNAVADALTIAQIGLVHDAARRLR